MTELRDYQLLAIDGLRESLRAGHRHPMLAAPTGAGKTKIAAAVVQNALDKKKRVAFTVPALSLIDQTLKEFWDEGIQDVGVYQGNHPLWKPYAPVQVCSVQTLEKRELPCVDLVIPDEAHIMRDLIWQWMEAKPDIPFVGLSATPWSRGLGAPGRYDDLIIAATTQQLIDEGHLSPFQVFAPTRPNLDGVRVVAGEFHAGDLAKMVKDNDRALVGDVVQTWLDLAERRPSVYFAVDRAHADRLCTQFMDAGVSTAYIDCFTPRDQRENIRMRFHAGLIEVVVNVDCLGVGVDWDIRCVGLVRPHRSEMPYVQKIGRGLRTADGKADCLILDHSSTTERLGFVTEIHHDTLDDGKPKVKREASQKVVLPHSCPQCSYLMAGATWTCPSCGFELPKPRPVSKVKTLDGSLAKFDKDSRVAASREEKIITYAMLVYYARERNYGKPEGWAAHKFKALFGHWPNGISCVTPRPPSPALHNWIVSRNIAWAKSKRRRQEVEA